MAISRTEFYIPASASEIRDDFLVDVRLEARKYADEAEVDRITRPGTDWHILATSVGNLGLLQYSNIAKAVANSSPLTATGAALDEIRLSLGLPDVIATPAAGAIVVTVQNGFANFNNNEFTLPNGKRGKINGVFNGIVNGASVPVITIDTGSDCNLASGEIVRFVAPPPNVAVNAKVSVGEPLTGGTDEETDERKRDRILNRYRTVPAGGNWGYVIEQCLNALGSVQYAFVYPALGGPASMKVVIVQDIDPDNYVFTRSMDFAARNTVSKALYAVMPDEIEIVVNSATDSPADVALSVTLPEAVSAGGNGQGWLDQTPWPNPTFADFVDIASISPDGTVIALPVTTNTAPVAGTNIAWWSSVDQKFYPRVIKSVAGMNGAWTITLYDALVDHNQAIAQVGEYISPGMVNVDGYTQTWRNSMRRLGPGENTLDANRLPRAYRRPFKQNEWYSELSIQQLLSFTQSNPEITDIEWKYKTPAIAPPMSIASPPYILVPNHFGMYRKT